MGPERKENMKKWCFGGPRERREEESSADVPERVHTHTHAHAHTYTHSRAHADTHIEFFAKPKQKCFNGRVGQCILIEGGK